MVITKENPAKFVVGFFLIQGAIGTLLALVLSWRL